MGSQEVQRATQRIVSALPYAGERKTDPSVCAAICVSPMAINPFTLAITRNDNGQNRNGSAQFRNGTGKTLFFSYLLSSR